jgi:hypothetical protein
MLWTDRVNASSQVRDEVVAEGQLVQQVFA